MHSTKMMNQMSNPWNQIQSPHKDVNVRRIDHTHPYELFWGKDGVGHCLFVFELPVEIDVEIHLIPEISGIKIELFKDQQNSNIQRLVLLLKNSDDWELFLALCNDVVQSTRKASNVKTATRLVIDRLIRWQEFLKKNRPELLSEEEIRGLIGELSFLARHLVPRFGIEQSIRYWQGPEGLPQDFNVGNTAIEVKSHGISTTQIHISSIDQLCPQSEDLFLYVISLGKTTPENVDAINLPLLIGRLRQEIIATCPDAINKFNDLIYLTGYIDSDRYLEYSYLFSRETMYCVTDSFPRICHQDLQPGIVKLSYSIDLEECADFEKYPDWISIEI